MTLRVNSIEYCHWQMLYSSHLEVVITFFFLGEVGDVFYGWSSAKSFPASSSTIASWQPTTFPPLVGPGRNATIWGFSKAILPTKAVTMSLRVTPVASKFSLSIEAVMISTHLLSSSAWSDGASEPVSSTTNLEVGTTQVSTSIGLTAQAVGRSFWISMSGLVRGTVASLPSRISAGPSRAGLTSALIDEVMGSAGVVSSLGGYPNDEGVVLCAPRLS